MIGLQVVGGGSEIFNTPAWKGPEKRDLGRAIGALLGGSLRPYGTLKTGPWRLSVPETWNSRRLRRNLCPSFLQPLLHLYGTYQEHFLHSYIREELLRDALKAGQVRPEDSPSWDCTTDPRRLLGVEVARQQSPLQREHSQ